MFPTAAEPWFGCFVKEQIDDLRQADIEVSVLHFDGRRGRQRYATAAVRLRGALMRGSYDLVHAHYGLAGLVALSQRRVPVVTTFHGSDFNGNVPWQLHVSRWVAKRATAIVVSPEGRERLKRRDALVIPVGVDMQRFKPVDRRAARLELGLDPDGTYALLAGARRLRNKRADLFDDAIALVRNRLPALRSLSLEGYARDVVPLVLNAADVLVMTSDREGAPVTVKEALACATPVVSVSVGDVPEVIRGLPLCAVVDRDPSQLAAAIGPAIGAARDRSLRDSIARYSRPSVAAEIARVYDLVASA